MKNYLSLVIGLVIGSKVTNGFNEWISAQPLTPPFPLVEQVIMDPLLPSHRVFHFKWVNFIIPLKLVPFIFYPRRLRREDQRNVNQLQQSNNFLTASSRESVITRGCSLQWCDIIFFYILLSFFVLQENTFIFYFFWLAD